MIDYNAIRKFVSDSPLPWLFLDPNNSLSLVVDNHLLSTHRSCAEAFMLQHVRGYQPKPGYGVPNERRWYLDFGIVFHTMMEKYYKHFRENNFNVLEWASEQSWVIWNKANIDGIYSKHPEYIAIGGFKGFVGLLLQYAHRFTPENEKLRIIGTEVSFGKDKEVLLYQNGDISIYLAGRMDVIVDDGYYIMPMDHKTVGVFRGDPSDRYIIDEGPTGYIYALNSILPHYAVDQHPLKRKCSRILMNAIQKSIPAKDPMDRFKRFVMLKSEDQLIAYERRMINSCLDLLLNLSRFIKGDSVSRDTSHCTDWYHGKCAFFDVHRQASREGEQATLGNGFVRLPIWDTENVSMNGV